MSTLLHLHFDGRARLTELGRDREPASEAPGDFNPRIDGVLVAEVLDGFVRPPVASRLGTRGDGFFDGSDRGGARPVHAHPAAFGVGADVQTVATVEPR